MPRKKRPGCNCIPGVCLFGSGGAMTGVEKTSIFSFV